MTKELLKEVSVSDLRDQLEAKEQMIKKYKKQLEIAVKCLKDYKYGTKDKWFAETALEQIKELDNDTN